MAIKLNQLASHVIDNLDSGISTHLKSAPGRGKSDFVKQLVVALSKRDGFEWGLATCMIATMTPSDLLGYMVPNRLETGELASVFTTPPWMMTKPTPEHPHGRNINTFKRGIVFLDEFGQGDGDTKKAAAPLMLSGSVGPHQLHAGIAVIAASNRTSDRSGVTKDFDFLINRQCEIEIMDDIYSWREWAATTDISPVTLAFAEQHPEIVFASGVPDIQGPWTTPRSLVMADTIMRRKAARNGGVMPEDPETVDAIRGVMGSGAVQYFNFVKLQRAMPKYEDIIANPKTAPKPDKPDAMMLVTYNLAHRVEPEHATAVVEYMARLGTEFSATFVTTAVRRNLSLVASPAFSKWCKDNSALMASIIKPAGK